MLSACHNYYYIVYHFSSLSFALIFYLFSLCVRDVLDGSNISIRSCTQYYYYITRSELASLAHSLLGGALILQMLSDQCNVSMLNCNWKWSLISIRSYRARAHPGRPCDSFNQLAKKLVTRLAASLARTPGKRRPAQNGLPLRSTHGQSPILNVALSSLSGRHW